jgi:putative ABC transport system permease protein
MNSRPISAAPRRRLALTDELRLGALGLTTRKIRAALSALGIAIGIAALVGVLGLSASSKADLLARLDRLGTNLLRVTPGQTFLGADAELPEAATSMIDRIGTVETAAATAALDVSIRRTDLIPETNTSGISVVAASASLPEAVKATFASGRWFDDATGPYPTVVLGASAARRLGVSDTTGTVQLWIGDQWFTLIGILDPVELAPELDESAILDERSARSAFETDLNPTTIYVVASEGTVDVTRDLLSRTANPENPEQVNVSRPSDALAAQIAAKGAFTSLFLGLGAVALLVGAVGIANVMVISVLERRREIGLRRALGATRTDVAKQFVTESLLLALLGGVLGAVTGTVLTVAYARIQHWRPEVPIEGLVIGVGGSLVIGAIAGLYPAVRAAGLPPTDALRSA